MPGTSARRSGSIWSTDWQRQADPGRREVAEAARQAPAGREAELPPLGAVHRRGVGSFGVGSPGRLAAELAPPGQERGVGEIGAARVDLLGHRRQAGLRRAAWTAGSASVVRRTTASAPSASDTTATTWPGRGPLEHVGQRHAGLGGAQVADPAVWSGATRRRRTPRLLAARHRPRVQAGHHQVVDVAVGQPGSFSAAAKAARARGT